MEFRPTSIPGCFEVRAAVRRDLRGSFTKSFNASEFEKRGLLTDFREDYYSHSKKDVIRGMHFQTPPHDCAKLVYCSYGKILDAVLDLRLGSATYKRHFTLELSADEGNMLYLPTGLAHGFCSLTQDSIVCYKVGAEYKPSHDKGVLWSSFGAPWPTANAILSERDQGFPPLGEFESPFRYE